jgi:hypothetical protein
MVCVNVHRLPAACTRDILAEKINFENGGLCGHRRHIAHCNMSLNIHYAQA